jgi:hypothetical protein
MQPCDHAPRNRRQEVVMSSKTRKLIGLAIALAVLTGGAALYLDAEAGGPYTVPTVCKVPCPPFLRVNDNAGGYYICLHTGTCTDHYVGQECDYQPMDQCHHIPHSF